MRMRLLTLVTAVFTLIAVSGLVTAAAASPTTITIASGAGVTPPPFGTVQDPNVEVSLDGTNWFPAHAADSAGYWPPAFPGSNWDVPSANRDQGYGDPQNFYYRISFVLPNGFTAPSLSGFMAADDQPVSVSLNGNTIARNMG